MNNKKKQWMILMKTNVQKIGDATPWAISEYE